MGTRPTISESATLEYYRVALDNVLNQPVIASEMSELGYDSEEIQKGKNILSLTRKAYDANKTEDDETKEAHASFINLKTQLDDIFTVHRKKAKVVFRNDPLTAAKLGISTGKGRSYIKWIESLKNFYSITIADTDIQTQLVRLKITLEDLNGANTLITEVETARSLYLREKGESQEATQIKDQAFYQIDDWMSEFFAVAKIALEDKPQLLEALGKIVRN